jgi:hypothetical protein
MAVSYTDVNPDPVASGIVQSFGRGGEFVHNVIAPLRTVPGKEFRFAKWDFGDMQSAHHETKMPDDGPANVREHRGLTFDTDFCVAHGLVERWGDTARGESALMNMEADHENAIWDDIRHELGLGAEAEVKTVLDAASNATTLTTTQQWDDSSADILGTFDLAKKAFRHNCGVNPTHVVIPEDCWTVLINDATILGLTKYTQSGIVQDTDAQLFKPIRGIIPIVPTVLKNSANPGATASVAELWSDDKVYFVFVNPAAATNMKALTSLYFAQAMTLPGMNVAADTWRPTDKTSHWTNYAVTLNRKLKNYDEMIYRLDDVLE